MTPWNTLPARFGALALAGTVALAPASEAEAGSVRTGIANMRLAMELCLRNYRTPQELADAFTRAGFGTASGLDAGFHDFTAPGVWGVLSTTPDAGFCSIQSSDVPLAVAEEMGLRLSRDLFGDGLTMGNPELPVGQPVPPCDGLSIFAPRMLIRVTYSAAGNSGDCLNDGTSAIQIRM